MESNKILMKEKLEFSGIIKEAFAIPYKNLNFIIFALLSALPLFLSMLVHEIYFLKTLTLSAKLSYNQFSSCHRFYCILHPFITFLRSTKIGYHDLVFLGLFYLSILYIIDLLNTIMIVNASSLLYAGARVSTLKDMLSRPINMSTLKGPLITSFYALALALLSSLGLVSLATQFYVFPPAVLLFFALFVKYMEWSAVWNMGIVISILEENKIGDIAIGVSAYVSKGRRRLGFLLNLVFFLWRYGLRFLCLYFWWVGNHIAIRVTIWCVGLACLGTSMKWVLFMVYFYDCKIRSLEKKVDIEEARVAELLKKYAT
ncbi:hypothetical protein RJ641_022729 [Dillenia turbinata]|uniref:Transmembrane protein n=1 Tax=Dillenia turbinata TaxID=194707 RepID=A0AAN8YXG1_9MAGN